jgi:hypothetical protein
MTPPASYAASRTLATTRPRLSSLWRLATTAFAPGVPTPASTRRVQSPNATTCAQRRAVRGPWPSAK